MTDEDTDPGTHSQWLESGVPILSAALTDYMFTVLAESRKPFFFFFLRAAWKKPVFGQSPPGTLSWTLWHFPEDTATSHGVE